MKGRKLKDRSSNWSDDHRFALAYMAEKVNGQFVHDEMVTVEDLMSEGWLHSLRRVGKEEIHKCFNNLELIMAGASIYGRFAISQYMHRQGIRVPERVDLKHLPKNLDVIDTRHDPVLILEEREEHENDKAECESILNKYDPIERTIIKGMFGISRVGTMAQLAKRFGVSRRQIGRFRHRLRKELAA